MREINKIYEDYFDIIDSYFGSIKNYLEDDKYSHIDLGMAIADYPQVSDLMLDAIDDLGSEIMQFWSENASKVVDSLREQDSLKCVYSGDITPVSLEDFAKKSLLYIDTIVMPDPALNLTILRTQTSIDKKYYLNKLIRHVFNLWKLKDLMLADLEKSALVILPINLNAVNEYDKNIILSNAHERFANYVSKIFKQEIDNENDALAFLEEFDDIKELFSAIKQTDLLPNIFKKFDTFVEFLDYFIDTNAHFQMESKTVGFEFGEYLLSQFIRVQEHKFFCEKVSGEPIYDYDLPYFFFSYEMGGLDMDASISNALQKEKFKWLGNVPLDALKILREENKLENMRSILRKGITDLKTKNDEDLLKTSEQLESNLKEAFEEQEEVIAALERKVEAITKKEIPLEITGTVVGFVPTIGSYISLLSAFRSIKNLFAQRKELKQKINDEKTDFINLLIKSFKEE